MKKLLTLILISLMVLIVAPGFRCGGGPENICDTYVSDSLIHDFVLENATAIRSPFDTIRVSSVINDSQVSVKGSRFLNDFENIRIGFQPYKVEPVAGGYVLNYASAEFNPLVTEGQLAMSMYSGFGFVFNRYQPYSRLRAAFVPGREGLYLFKANFGDYYYSSYVYNGQIPCTQFYQIPSFENNMQNLSYWDELGTTSLRLNGANNMVVTRKNDRDYFFVKVGP